MAPLKAQLNVNVLQLKTHTHTQYIFFVYFDTIDEHVQSGIRDMLMGFCPFMMWTINAKGKGILSDKS